MQNKKNWSQNLENYRGLFFMAGLALSLAIVTEIFQWTTEYKVPELKGEKREIVESGIRIPITVPEKPEIPEPETKEPEPEPVEPIKPTTKFKAVDNNTKIEPSPKIDLTGLDTVGIEPALGGEIIAPVEAFSVENMARPKECEELHGHKEQMDCFNRWIQGYLAEETIFPERSRRLGESEKIYVEFVIGVEGEVQEAKVIRGENEDFKAEALRVITQMPSLVPASQMGQAVPVRVRIPVNFKLR